MRLEVILNAWVNTSRHSTFLLSFIQQSLANSTCLFGNFVFCSIVPPCVQSERPLIEAEYHPFAYVNTQAVVYVFVRIYPGEQKLLVVNAVFILQSYHLQNNHIAPTPIPHTHTPHISSSPTSESILQGYVQGVETPPTLLLPSLRLVSGDFTLKYTGTLYNFWVPDGVRLNGTVTMNGNKVQCVDTFRGRRSLALFPADLTYW
jgi:hypothetical protein